VQAALATLGFYLITMAIPAVPNGERIKRRGKMEVSTVWQGGTGCSKICCRVLCTAVAADRAAAAAAAANAVAATARRDAGHKGQQQQL
jgi:hypothetical protein